MIRPDRRSDHIFADSGLLSPGWAGTDVDDLLGDRAWLIAMVTVEVALARAEARIGMIPPAAAQAIAAAADSDDFDWPALVAGVHATGNPVVMLVPQLTKLVRAANPAAAEFVHQGSTSQDIFDSATMLICRQVLDRVRTDLNRVADALAQLAQLHRQTVMAGRTLTQHAVPITFGLKAAGWLNQVLDARARLEQLLASGLPVSLGGAAGTLAGYQEFTDRDVLDLVKLFAEELGLAVPIIPWHASRTPIADLAAVLAAVCGALGKLAADVAVLTRTEIGELMEPSEPSRGSSSAMPQKQNPIYTTAIATAARQIPALVLVLHQSMVVEDERSAGGWHAEWQPLREALRLLAGAARNATTLTEGLVVVPERMWHNVSLTGGAIVAERLGARVASLVGRSTAKVLLGRAIAMTADQPDRLPDVLTELLREHGLDTDLERWRTLSQPAGYTGASARLTDRVLERYHTLTKR